jgi:hypothetical protein
MQNAWADVSPSSKRWSSAPARFINPRKVRRPPESAETHGSGAGRLGLIGPKRLILRSDERRIDQHGFCANDTKHVNLTALRPGIASCVSSRFTIAVVPDDRSLSERNSDQSGM